MTGKVYKIPGKKAICFDLNETLIHQGIHFEQAFRSVCSEYGARGLEQDQGEVDSLWDRYQANWQLNKKTRGPAVSFDQLQEQSLQQAIQEQQIPVHQGFAKDFFRLVRQRRIEGKTLVHGVESTLRNLSGHFKLAIISNSPHNEVIHLLERFQLHAFFPPERIFTAHKLSEKKPGSSLFKTALQTLELTPRQAVMVGNSWKHDVCGAVKAGLDVIWLQAHQENTKKISRQKLGKRNIYCIQEINQLLELFQ
ncbi:HAD family hydrolase [Paenibacillus periandrae]|uniref:HAD family hydrolase n=1 Tax=Paenibacillus periandrae TaxID=1761741 RepID=UPI001F088823|nr:HAD family hydrolase [Paenibacillus periandrae]